MRLTRVVARYLNWLGALSGLIVVVGLVQSCSQPSIYKWRLQSYAPATATEYIELVALTDKVRQMSQGRFDIQAYPGGKITSGADIYTAVKERRIEMGNGWPNWWAGHNPAWAVMNAGPYEFMNIDASMFFFTVGEGSKLANELANADGILWRPAWWAGMEFGLLSREPIRSLKELAGKKVRIGPGLPSEVLVEASGASAIPLVPAEIRLALESGDIDAVEWTTTAGAWDLGLSDVAPYAIVPAIWQPAVLSDFLINQQAYLELPEDLQQILTTAMDAYTLTTTAKAKVADLTALRKFEEGGTTLYRWSPEDLQRWKQASDKVHARYSQQDEFSKYLLQAKQQFKSEYDSYYEVFAAYD